MTRDLYDKICYTLTEYENVDGYDERYSISQQVWAEELYNLLCDVVNEWEIENKIETMRS